MSANLNQLRRNYCQPGSFTGKRNYHLFPLEKVCEEGKALLSTTPETVVHDQAFDPNGLKQTYRDAVSGAELPLFAVFDLDKSHLLTLEITADPLRSVERTKDLSSYLPLQGAKKIVSRINDCRRRSERILTALCIILGTVPVSCFLLLHPIPMVAAAVPSVFVGGWILSAFLFYLVNLFFLDRLLPWKKFTITAEFNGILPKEVRKKALLAKDHFDKLYLVTDQQHRWKSAFLPDPRPRILDPLLIGEIKEGDAHKYFLIDQFDLTQAEQYLADEFAFFPAG